VAIEEHRARAAKIPPARFAILSVTDKRTRETDDSGILASGLLEKHGHAVSRREIVPNDPDRIREAISSCLASDVQVVLTIGGTGVSPRDRTVETAAGFIERVMPGFGELFRQLSRSEIGSAVILSRAVMGVTPGGQLIICTPGSKGAVRLALEEIVLKELGHILGELRRKA
jgi:molybdenum cofactor biosynthesis protein B